MYNFKLENVDVHEFLNRLKIRNIEDATEEEVKFSCPFPGHTSGDENPSAYMNVESTAWYCHGCKRKGNAISFLSDLYNLSNVQSTNMLKEIFGGTWKAPDTTLEDEINRHFLEFGKPAVEPINYSLQKVVLNDFYSDEITMLDYMWERGFTNESLAKWEIKYDKISGRIAIPIFDEVGRLVGFKGRSIDPEDKPKYKVLGGSKYGFPRYHVGLVVYGMDKVSEDVRTCIIVEGELNAIAMHQMGFTNAIAAGGSTFTEVHASKIIDRFDSAVLFFDSDKAGWEATSRANELLSPHIPVRVVPDHDYDPADVLQTFAPKGQRLEIEGCLSGSCDMLSLMVDNRQ
jgi:DNA primase